MAERRAVKGVAGFGFVVFALLHFTAVAFVRQRPELPVLVVDGLPSHVRDALREAYAAAAARPDAVEAVAPLAKLLHAHEQYAAAAVGYRRARELEPRSAAWAYLSGVVQQASGDLAAAVESFRAAIRLDAELLPARVRLAETLLELGDRAASVAEFTALRRDFPDLAIAHYGLGRLSTLAGDHATAAGHYQRAIKAAPQFGAAHYALALAYRDSGQPERAKPHMVAYQKLQMRRPAVLDPLLDSVHAMRSTARDLLDEAARLEAEGRLPESIAKQLAALDRDPGAGQAHVNLIALYGRTGDPAKAEAHYRAALKIGISLADAHYNYGVLLASLQREDEAMRAFGEAIDVDPFHAAAHNNLASLLARRQRYAEAAAHYRQTLESDPQHETARFNLGRVLALLGRSREAADVLQQALERAERAGNAKLAAAIRQELQRIAARK